MDKDNNEIDDLFFDFFKEKVNGKGAQKANENFEQPTPMVNKKEVAPKDNLSSNPVPNNNAAPTPTPQPIPKPNPTPSPNPTPNRQQDNSPYTLSETNKKRIREEQLAQMLRRSEEVDEILSYVPHWMIRWGIGILFFIILGLLTMSYYIQYPDVVNGTITITSIYPPAELVSRNGGALILYQEDKSQVEEGDVIALLKNPANYEDIQQLKLDLEQFKTTMSSGRFMNIYDNYSVGSLRNAYSNLVMAVKGHQLSQNSMTNDATRKQSLTNQIVQLKKVLQKQRRSISNLEREHKTAKDILRKRYVPLFSKGSISKEQLEQKQSDVRIKFNSIQSAKVTLSETQNRILDLETQQAQLDFTGTDKLLNSENKVADALHYLTNEITQWEEQYLLKAPISGTLNYLQFVKDNMFVKPDQLLASIIPVVEEEANGADTYIGELFIEPNGSGKVEEGQDVKIELNDFVKKEYGWVEGKVASIADIGSSINTADGVQGAYKVNVHLPNGLTTTLSKEVGFKYNMQGKAEIITKDVRLLERIFSEIRNAFDSFE